MKLQGLEELVLWRSKKRKLTESLGSDLFADTALDVLIDVALSYEKHNTSIEFLAKNTGLPLSVLNRYIDIFEKRNLIQYRRTHENIMLTSHAKELLGL